MEKDFFDQHMRTFKKLQLFKGMITQPVVYFKNYYKMIAVDLRKQQTLDVDPKVIQEIKFTGNLDQAGNTAMFLITKEAKETILDFCKEL